jgi:hypothetical protein
MNGINGWCAVNIGRTRLAGALGFGPFCSFIVGVFGKQRTALCFRVESDYRNILDVRNRVEIIQPTTLTIPETKRSEVDLIPQFNGGTYVCNSLTPTDRGANAVADRRMVRRSRTDFIMMVL